MPFEDPTQCGPLIGRLGLALNKVGCIDLHIMMLRAGVIYVQVAFRVRLEFLIIHVLKSLSFLKSEPVWLKMWFPLFDLLVNTSNNSSPCFTVTCVMWVCIYLKKFTQDLFMKLTKSKIKKIQPPLVIYRFILWM